MLKVVQISKYAAILILCLFLKKPRQPASTDHAIGGVKNTGAYPEGIIGSECSGGGQTPVT